LDSNRIHDRADIVGLLLDRRCISDLVGQAKATSLKVNRSRIKRVPFEGVVHVWVGPEQVKVK
jgi:hypothetical protein